MTLANRILILVPTEIELRFVREGLGATEHAEIELCGFGPVVAAARTAFLIDRFKPKLVLLLGIAGRLNEELVIGSAYEFNVLGCYGIGAGQGAEFRTSGELGWQQWPQAPVVADALYLQGGHSWKRQLLTCCSASSNQQDVQQRLEKFPNAMAEDMEGFAVAVACGLAEVPLRVVRGISNQAGDRDHRHWKINEAMQSALTLAQQIVFL